MARYKFEFDAIGTRWEIDIINSPDNLSEKYINDKVRDRIDLFDRTYSRFRQDSLIFKMSVSKGEYTLPEDAKPLFDLYQKLYYLTDGDFTPFVGDLLSDAGYDHRYSLKPKILNSPSSWDESISYHFPKISFKKPFLLDFGAGGKGYLVDIISNLLIEMGLSAYIIDAGGDIFYQSSNNKKLRVGLEHPEDFKKVLGVASIIDQAICASARNRRKWGKYHHIISPKTLTSPNDILSIWVVAENTLLADALSTCLFLTKPEILIKEFKFEYLIIYPDYSLNKSPAFPAELFYNK